MYGTLRFDKLIICILTFENDLSYFCPKFTAKEMTKRVRNLISNTRLVSVEMMKRLVW